MKRSNILALAFAVVLSGLSVGAAHAAPVAAPPCYRNSSATHDMAGRYYAPEIPALIEVNNCGGAEITWDNDSGRHNAYYGAVDRLPGGGFIAKADEALDGIFPNNAEIIAIKPAERGAIQMITTNSNGDINGVYHLTKVR